MNIIIQIKSVYGEAKAYPVDTAAKHFASIAGTKTLTKHTLANVLGLGFQIWIADGYGNISAKYSPTNLHQVCALIAA
jgi:hypothetical protein